MRLKRNEIKKEQTIAFSNMFLMFSSDWPDTPETSSVDVTLSKGKSNSFKQKYFKNTLQKL